MRCRQADRQTETGRQAEIKTDRIDRKGQEWDGGGGGGAKDKTKKHMYLKILKLNHTIKSLLC